MNIVTLASALRHLSAASGDLRLGYVPRPEADAAPLDSGRPQDEAPAMAGQGASWLS